MMHFWKKLNNGAKPSDKLRCVHIRAMREQYKLNKAAEAYLKAAKELGE